MIVKHAVQFALAVGHAILALALSFLLLAGINWMGIEAGLSWLRFPHHNSPEWHKWSFIVLAGIVGRVVFDSIDRIVAKFRKQRQ